MHVAETPHGLISGRYRLGELLGTGGSASVFAAVDTAPVGTAPVDTAPVDAGAPDPRGASQEERPEPGVPRTVALKILHPHLSGSAEAREAFFAEALAAERLHHPNIVEVLNWSEMPAAFRLLRQATIDRDPIKAELAAEALHELPGARPVE